MKIGLSNTTCWNLSVNVRPSSLHLCQFRVEDEAERFVPNSHWFQWSARFHFCLLSGFPSLLHFVSSHLKFRWSNTFWTENLSCSSFYSGVPPSGSGTPRMQIPKTEVLSISRTDISFPAFSDPTFSEKVGLFANFCTFSSIFSINFRQSFCYLSTFRSIPTSFCSTPLSVFLPEVIIFQCSRSIRASSFFLI